MREKLFLSLQEYGTFMYVQNQFPLTFPSNTGKDSYEVDTSLPLTAVTY